MGTGLREKIYEVFSNDLADDVLKALPAIHALSGCDSTSAFLGIGKVKMHNAVCKVETFLAAAALLGENEVVIETVLDTLEEPYCRLYGFKIQTSINQCRYETVTKKKIPDPERIPPTKDSLNLHIMRCNYQVREWKKAIDGEHIPNDPQGCRWEKTGGKPEIKWMSNRPAPDEALEFTTCSCKKTHCATNQCQCFSFNLKCMDLCECRSCSNKIEELDEEVDEDVNDLDEETDDDLNSDNSDYSTDSE